MRATRWTALILSAVTIAAEAGGLRGGSPAASDRDFQQQAAALSDPATGASERQEAARRIVEFYLRRRPEALAVLRDALVNSGNDAAQRCAAWALADDPDANPLPEFVDPLLGMLGPNKASSEAAAEALADYKANPLVLQRLSEFVGEGNPALEGSRAAAIRAMGKIIEKAAAQRLIQVLRDDAADPVISDAAADALGQMTSLGFGHDAARWQAWWAQETPLPEGQWQDQQLRRRADAAARLQRQEAELREQIAVLLRTLYRSAPASQKQDFALQYLQNPSAAIRQAGAALVTEDILEGRVPDPVRVQLRSMVGDSSAEVRMQVAKAVGYINDQGAVDALLAQLAVEGDPDVRAALAAALAPTHDVRAVPALLDLLGDPSLIVAEAAATALADQDMSKAVRADGPPDHKLEHKAATALTKALERTTVARSGALRPALASALGSLRDPSLLTVLLELQGAGDPDNDARVRRAAVKGLGQMEAPDARAAAAHALVVSSLKDPDVGVRLEAVRAIGNAGTFAQADTLYDLFNKTDEDKEVRAAAWDVLAELFYHPDTPANQLFFFADRLQHDFPNDATRRLEALKALAGKLLAPKEANQLAVVDQDIAEIYLTKLEQPDQAVQYFRSALEERLARSAPEAAVLPLVDQLMEAWMRARNYGEAVQFAQEHGGIDRAKLMDAMGLCVTDEVARLRDAGDIPGALRLIDEVNARLKTPLEGRFGQQLRLLEEQMRPRPPATIPATLPTTAP